MSDDNSDDITGKDRRAASGAKPIKRKRLVVSKAPYEVGYARPPVESRFKPGQSGNPSGRPRGAKNKPSRETEKIKDTFSKIAGQKITIRKGDKTARISKMDYILNSAVDRAAKGHPGMTRLVIGMGMGIEQEKRRSHDRLLEEAIAYKQHWSDELLYRRMKGIHGAPEPIPHPDDVLIGRDGTVSIVGPMTPEEKKYDNEIEVQRDTWKAQYAKLDVEVKSLMRKLRERRGNPHRIRKELFQAIEDSDSLEKLLKATSREARYCAK